MSIKAKPKKKRGRPATGRDPMMGFRAAPMLRASIVQWAVRQPDAPSLSEATRRLVELGLKVHAPESKAVKGLRKRVARAAELAALGIDSLTVSAADADEKASRKRRRQS